MTDKRPSLPLKRIHHVELWVGNALQAAYFYRKAFGFSQLAYAGLETGSRDRMSVVLEQGNIRLVLTSPLSDGGPINDHLRRHGDGVKDICFEVDDADSAFDYVTSRDARVVAEPRDVSDVGGSVRQATIQTYGDTVHSFVSRGDFGGVFLPGYVEQRIDEPGTGLVAIDHIVGNVEQGKMNAWAEFYARVFGFERYISFDDKDISTEYTALMSVVMTDERRLVKFPINEPADGKRLSQIQEYLDFYNGPGVQHLALATTDIVGTVKGLMDRGVPFLNVPDTYYDDLRDRVGEIDEDTEVLRPLGVLVDRDDSGYLLQLFSKPLQDRPTLFFEIIQRKGAHGFGKGNFKALFESIEREQARRGTL